MNHPYVNELIASYHLKAMRAKSSASGIAGKKERRSVGASQSVGGFASAWIPPHT